MYIWTSIEPQRKHAAPKPMRAAPNEGGAPIEAGFIEVAFMSNGQPAA
jgi:hypothetical protein